MMRCLIVILTVLGASLGLRATAQEEKPPPTVLVVRPAKEPVPALRYRLLPDPAKLVPGNAAIFYHRAVEKLLERNYRRIAEAARSQPAVVQPSPDVQISEWLVKPVDQIPMDEARRLLDSHRDVLHEIELGARRETCDWEFRNRDEGFSLDLSEIQQSRSLARLVLLQARFDIAEGRIDSAIQWIQTGLALARHTGDGQFYIQSLVEAAIADQMSRTIEALIQAPGCPNLYWALAALPRPFLDLTSATESERRILEREFPGLRDIEKSVWSLEEARAFGDGLEKNGEMLMGKWGRAASSLTRPTVEDLSNHLRFAGLIARAYPEAKRALIASGEAPERIEAMPAIQVVVIHSYRIFEAKRDELFKWANLPYLQGRQGMLTSNEKIFRGAPLGIPFIAILPSIQSVLDVPPRLDRRFAVLRTIEAVRQYAASHDGSPPPTLEALIETPAPRDPVTDKPFAYAVNESGFTLTAPPPPGLEMVPKLAVNYEVKIAH